MNYQQQEGSDMTKKKLYLVAVDGSEWGERAAERAVSLAAETGANVKLVTVIPWSGYQPISIEELAHRPVARHEEEKHAIDDILQPLKDKNSGNGVDITTHFDWGDPVQTIRELAKKDHATMVFVGRRGRSRLSDLILGSVANSLAHSLGVPIVLVP